MVDTLTAAQDALNRHAWAEAYETFAAADGDSGTGLGPQDLEAMAEAAWWAGRPDEAEDALQRAFAGHSRAGDQTAAALVAVRLSTKAFERGSVPVSQGWMSQAERMLAHAPESGAHGWMELIRTADALVLRNDPDAAIEHAERALDLGFAYDVPDLQAMGTALKGAALLRRGDIESGMALIDEAAALATTGALGPKTACDVYCVTISSCRTLADYRRAREWIDIAERWMRRESIAGYNGVCRVHRAELTRLRGAWSEAEHEARLACEELEQHGMLSEVGYAYAEVGEARRHKGDLDGAEEAFARAYEYGWSPQPGLALLHLARGEADEAASSIARSLATLDEVAGGTSKASNPLARAMLLPASVEIALSRGDLATAEAGATELEQIAALHPTAARQAHSLTARGRVLLAQGRNEEAITALDQAWRLWQGLSVPYESARPRVLLGQARRAAGDERGSVLEFRSAQSVFKELGAEPDLAVVAELLGETEVTVERRRVVKTFMFTDIVTSTDLIGLIGDEAWEELLQWHDRTLRTAFESHDGEVVRHTGDGFFVTFDDPAAAVRCAVDIQRQLAEHRHQHGFAPWVRIGMHAAEATKQGSDYTGREVHVAARVAGLADKEQIVVTSSVLDGSNAKAFPTSPSRPVTLKGINEAVAVHTVDWR
jgi:class 3 adenylate cyclase